MGELPLRGELPLPGLSPLPPDGADRPGTADVAKDQAADLGQSGVEAGQHAAAPYAAAAAEDFGQPVRPPGPAARKLAGQAAQFDAEQASATPDAAPDGDLWVPGDAPSLAGRRAVEAAAKAGSVGIIGVPAGLRRLSDRGGDEQEPDGADGQLQPPPVHPPATRPGRGRLVDPAAFITQEEKPAAATEACESFDRREEGWVQTVLEVS